MEKNYKCVIGQFFSWKRACVFSFQSSQHCVPAAKLCCLFEASWVTHRLKSIWVRPPWQSCQGDWGYCQMGSLTHRTAGIKHLGVWVSFEVWTEVTVVGSLVLLVNPGGWHCRQVGAGHWALDKDVLSHKLVFLTDATWSTRGMMVQRSRTRRRWTSPQSWSVCLWWCAAACWCYSTFSTTAWVRRRHTRTSLVCAHTTQILWPLFILVLGIVSKLVFKLFPSFIMVWQSSTIICLQFRLCRTLDVFVRLVIWTQGPFAVFEL